MRVLVTGGAGFIGSAVVRRLMASGNSVLNVDKLTYAGSLEPLREIAASSRYQFSRTDICDRPEIGALMSSFDPQLVLHLAAESHVDRSIENSVDFVRTNVLGTHSMLDASLDHWQTLDDRRGTAFRFVHVSTDEVYGALGATGSFTESSPYAPNSPYAASKAGSDHLARAWQKTHGLPVVTTHCSNNYGRWQHPEKLIPTIIRNALAGKPIPIYGSGTNVRDWLFIEDHVDGILAAAGSGRPGESYNFGGGAELTNLQVAEAVCYELDKLRPRADGARHADAITFVADRPGHDFRYSVDAEKAKAELGWAPRHDFGSGLAQTIAWYLENPDWFVRPEDDLKRKGTSRVPNAGDTA